MCTLFSSCRRKHKIQFNFLSQKIEIASKSAPQSVLRLVQLNSCSRKQPEGGVRAIIRIPHFSPLALFCPFKWKTWTHEHEHVCVFFYVRTWKVIYEMDTHITYKAHTLEKKSTRQCSLVYLACNNFSCHWIHLTWMESSRQKRCSLVIYCNIFFVLQKRHWTILSRRWRNEEWHRSWLRR